MESNGRTKVLIAGGGVAALEAALALRELAGEHVTVELLAPEMHFLYKPAAVAEPFEHGHVTRFELDGLARQIGASFTPGGLTGIDSWRHVAYTSKNTQIPYDSLLVACGALPFPAVPGGLTFRGPADVELIEHLLAEIQDGDVRSVAFVIPWGAVWPLPAYELALLTATYVRQRSLEGVELTLVTPEAEPLQLFGSPAIHAARELLDEHGVILQAGAHAGKFMAGELELIPDDRLSVDRVVALPRLQGAPIDGLPQTVHGFIPVDSHCRVEGVDDVFAAGDITNFTVKQGGIAAQQADVAAEAIAAAAGVRLTPRRFQPVLRGLLLTGGQSRYLRAERRVPHDRAPVASYEPLWWPPAKIMSRYLSPFLASLAGADPQPSHVEPAPGAVSVEVELDPGALDRLASGRLMLADDDRGAGERVEDLMSSEPLIVAPEDTLGEVAERFLKHGDTAAAVAEYGRLIGILTAGDLVRAAAMRVHPSEGRVRQWMTADPITVSTGSSVANAARLMTEYGVHHMPVVDDGHVAGMLYLDDTLRRSEALTIGLGL